MSEIQNNKNQILIYKTETGQYIVEVLLDGDTVWLTQQQMATLFDKSKSTINEHIQNIYDSKELILNETMKKFGISEFSTKPTNYYNLDVIIAVGYRVNSIRGTQFRIWATRTIKEHLLKGYTVNQKRITETGIKELENALLFIKQASNRRQLTNEEAQGLLDIITKYAKSWLLLKSYDEDNLPIIKGQSPKFSLTYEQALNSIKELKKTLIAKGEASGLFGNEREHGLKAILGNIEQCFDGQDLYPTLEDKAAHLLYFIIKITPSLTAINALHLCYLSIT